MTTLSRRVHRFEARELTFTQVGAAGSVRMHVRKNMRTRARARINNRSAGSVLRMHTFKRFVHHSLSRVSVDVQAVTSLAAEETDGGRRWRLRRHVACGEVSRDQDSLSQVQQ